ncbi:hypothetical protein KC340_g130 [Hortaea werneckii]|nr:hypothetical protein KC340_g130 [Hortaea werneckii]
MLSCLGTLRLSNVSRISLQESSGRHRRNELSPFTRSTRYMNISYRSRQLIVGMQVVQATPRAISSGLFKPRSSAPVRIAFAASPFQAPTEPRIRLHPLERIKILASLLRKMLNMRLRERVVLAPIRSRELRDPDFLLLVWHLVSTSEPWARMRRMKSLSHPTPWGAEEIPGLPHLTPAFLSGSIHPQDSRRIRRLDFGREVVDVHVIPLHGDELDGRAPWLIIFPMRFCRQFKCELAELRLMCTLQSSEVKAALGKNARCATIAKVVTHPCLALPAGSAGKPYQCAINTTTLFPNKEGAQSIVPLSCHIAESI